MFPYMERDFVEMTVHYLGGPIRVTSLLVSGRQEVSARSRRCHDRNRGWRDVL